MSEEKKQKAFVHELVPLSLSESPLQENEGEIFST